MLVCNVKETEHQQFPQMPLKIRQGAQTRSFITRVCKMQLWHFTNYFQNASPDSKHNSQNRKKKGKKINLPVSLPNLLVSCCVPFTVPETEWQCLVLSWLSTYSEIREMSEVETSSSLSRNQIKSLTVNSNQTPAAQLADPQRNEYDTLEDIVAMVKITTSIGIISGERKEIA